MGDGFTFEHWRGSVPATLPAEPGESGGVRSVQRAFDILSLLTEDRRTLTIREVVDETGLAKTTALRLLQRVARASPGGAAHLATLRRWIEEAARAGHAVSHGEREPGLSAVAVPVTGGSRATVAALTLSGPTVRSTEERVEEFTADLREAAKRMSERGVRPSTELTPWRAHAAVATGRRQGR